MALGIYQVTYSDRLFGRISSLRALILNPDRIRLTLGGGEHNILENAESGGIGMKLGGKSKHKS